jgi:hypothetical protein
MFKASGKFLRVAFISAMVLALSVIVAANVSADVTVPGCTLSFPIQTGWAVTGTSVNANTIGHIGREFSTLRPKPGQPGKVIYAPAQFTVTPDTTAGLFNNATTACHDGELYLHLTYAGSIGSGWALMSSVNDPVHGPGHWLVPGPIPPVATATPVATPVATATPAPVAACNATNTPNSLPTIFTGTFPQTGGKIAQAFSTLRPSIGATDAESIRVYRASSPEPRFDVLGSQSSGGFCWLNIRYTAGPASIVGKTGWALESQIFPDNYGVGRWLTK